MPDTNFPKVTRAEEDLTIMLSEQRPDQVALSRKWSCPGDHAIAAYVDGELGNFVEAWIEFHLSGCQRCRLLVGDIVKAQREFDLPHPPVQLIRKAMDLVGPQPARPRWVWAPAGVLAGIALLGVITFMVRKPEQLAVVPPPALHAPLVAKSEPTPALHTPVRDVVRKLRTPQLLPTIVFPRADNAISRDRLQIRWNPMPQSRKYEVRVVRSDGDLVWEGQTDKSAVQVPAEVTVKEGSYFVWITAFLEDGHTAKSAPVHFLVKQ